MLITIRRLLAVFLLPIFLVLFVATLTIFRVNATLLEADFYTGTLERLDVFTFLYDEALPFAIEDSGIDLAGLPLGIDLTADAIAGYAARVLPPDWLAENVGGAIEQAVPYITGETDTFEITLRLDDRVEAADVVVRDLLRDARIHAYLLDEVVRPTLDREQASFQAGLPFNPGLTTDEILDGVRDVVPEEWLKERIEDVLDQVVPYMIGREESFSINIPLQQRADAGIVVVGGWLSKSLDGGAYDYLLEEQIAPIISEFLGSAVALPYGVTVTNEEIVEAISQVLPPDWVQERVSEAIDAFGPYLTGRTDGFVLSIPLEDRAALAAEVLVDAVDAKFEAVYTALPACTFAQLDELGALTLTELPECRPPITYGTLKGIIGLDVGAQLAAAIVDPLPDSIEVTEQSLLGAFGDTAGGVSVDSVRGYLRDGYTFTDQDLRRLLAENIEGADVVGTMDSVRGYLRDGITFDESSIAGVLGGNVGLFDDVRGWVNLGRGLLFLLIVLLAFVALVIGFLGGRRWGTRLVWAGVPVLMAGVLLGGIFSAASGPLRAFSDGPIRGIDTTPVLTDKLLDVRDDLVASFVDPIAAQGLASAALGFAMIVAGVFWARRPVGPTALPTPAVPYESAEARAAGLVVDAVREELEPETAAAFEESDPPDGSEPAEPAEPLGDPEEDGPTKPGGGT
ncbi:MAG: hypothetical protein IIC31_07470 [Chloroflexi bacterium]|nr:hypothetical protein [Chloroflexota bacterium]